MDPVIQGLTQSAIVQKLSETEHAVKRFTPDLPDNAPYRSLSKRVVQPFRGTNSGSNSPSSTLDFSVPRNGFLTRTYLRCVVQFAGPTPVPQAPTHTSSNLPRVNNFANFFERAHLLIDGKIVETLYPEQIMASASELSGGEGERVLKGLRGLLTSFSPEEIGEGVLDLDAIQSFYYYGYFTIPLDFSTFKFHKDALDVNFLGRVEIRVEKRPFRIFPSGESNDSTKCELVCKYYNVHEHFRTQIRNGMHGKETQTKLMSSGYRVNTLPVTSNSNTHHVYDLTGLKLYVSDIFISFRAANRELLTGPNFNEDFKLTLQANGRTLFEKNHYEMREDMVGASSNYAGDEVSIVQASKHFNMDNTIQVLVNDGMDLPPSRLLDRGDISYYEHSLGMYRIPLKHVNTDEFLSGGLDLTSLTNVELIIDGYDFGAGAGQLDIVLNHKNMLRIDSKTGTVSL